MNALKTALAAVAIAALAGPAAAQFKPLTPSDGFNGFGDTKLAYQNGVVYDDDLVPGRTGSQNFLVGETTSGINSTLRQDNLSGRLVRPDSPNLIGRDGRIYTGR